MGKWLKEALKPETTRFPLKYLPFKGEYKEWKISAMFTGEKPHLLDEEKDSIHRHYLVTISKKEINPVISFDYYCSQKRPFFKGLNDLVRAFECFILDANIGTMEFEDFCTNFGYDTDSRKAYDTHIACTKSLQKMFVFIRSLDELEELSQELQEFDKSEDYWRLNIGMIHGIFDKDRPKSDYYGTMDSCFNFLNANTKVGLVEAIKNQGWEIVAVEKENKNESITRESD